MLLYNMDIVEGAECNGGGGVRSDGSEAVMLGSGLTVLFVFNHPRVAVVECDEQIVGRSGDRRW